MHWLTLVAEAALRVTNGDKANVQLFSNNTLRLAAHTGFEPPFLEFFHLVRDSDSACGVAMQALKPTVVSDVGTSPIFQGKESREVMLQAGSFSVVSVPLIARSGSFLGMLSAHRRTIGDFEEPELKRLEWVARQAAGLLEGDAPAMAMRTIEVLARAYRAGLAGVPPPLD